METTLPANPHLSPYLVYLYFVMFLVLILSSYLFFYIKYAYIQKLFENYLFKYDDNILHL